MMNLFARLTRTPRLIRNDLLLLVLPMMLWGALLVSRPYIIKPHCQVLPGQQSSCQAENVIKADRVALGLNSSEADGYSYFTQNLAGVLAFSTPVLWHSVQSVLGRVSLLSAMTAMTVDINIMLQTTLWNGALGEFTRGLTQRPRPFVYADPAAAGPNVAHYISFYSGHTSFTAAASFALFLFFLGRGAPQWLAGLSFVAFELLTFSTGIFRILAGRHFVTDVLAAAVAGSAIAFMIAWLHRDPSSESSGTVTDL